MKEIDTIGYWKGRGISTMTHRELLDFASWASQKISALEKIEIETYDCRIDKEVRSSLK